MFRTRNPISRAGRNPNRCAGRQRTRANVRCLPGYRRGPDDLSQSLTALTRVIRCRRRLAKLAPSFFDAAVVAREAREREEQRQWMASWEPAFEKVYGPDPTGARRASVEPGRPPLPGLRTQRVVDRELAEMKLWMEISRVALDRHEQRRPHAVLGLSQLARLIEVADTLGRLACGLDLENRPSHPPGPSYAPTWEQACQKMYGKTNRSLEHD